jgi:hypothetical protein
MSADDNERIERHVLRKFEICQRLGKGVSLTFPLPLPWLILCDHQ